jgi:hypothetical protein
MQQSLPNYREVLEFLDDVRTLNRRLGPYELIALWFDALYFPVQSHVSPEAQVQWSACFSSRELSALAGFNAIFNSLADRLPKSEGWEQDSGWLRVSAAATDALKELKREA